MKRKYTDAYSSAKYKHQVKIQLNSPVQKKILRDELKSYIMIKKIKKDEKNGFK